MAFAVETGNGKRSRAETTELPKKSSHGFLDSFEKAATNISKGMKKVKRNYMEKVMSFEPTAEPPEFAEVLHRYEFIQQRMDSLPQDTITGLYDASITKAQGKLALSEQLMSLESTPDQDLFRSFADNVVGRKLFKINHMTNEYLVKMEKELINPLSIYRSKEMSKASRLMEEYATLKEEYDYAHHKYTKLLNSKLKQQDSKGSRSMSKGNKTTSSTATTAKVNATNHAHHHSKEVQEDPKIQGAELKMFSKLKPLQEARHHLTESINDLERKQHCDLLQCIDSFWSSYRIFSERQSEILNLKDRGDDAFEGEKRMKAMMTSPSDDDVKSTDTDLFGSISDFQSLTKMTSLRVAESMNDFKPIEKELRYKNAFKLGSGAFATVYRANDLLNAEKEVAIKVQ